MTGNRFQKARVAKAFGVVALAAIALTACRAEEQGRLIKYEPGVYKGKPDTQLSATQLDVLRERTRSQSGVSAAGFAGGAAPVKDSGPDVRAPGDLRERALKQGGVK